MKTKDIYGPGYWAAMHIRSLKATTYEEKIRAATQIAMDVSGFPCTSCRNHGIQYISHNPLIHPINDKDKHSLFKWTVDFHNAVNERIEKPIFSYDEARKKWGEEGICMEDGCEEEDEYDNTISDNLNARNISVKPY